MFAEAPGPRGSSFRFKQLAMVQRTILRLAFPGGKSRPKLGAYRGPTFRTSGERNVADLAGAASQ